MATNHNYNYLTSYVTSYVTSYFTSYMMSCVTSYLLIPISRYEQSSTTPYGHRVLHCSFL